VRIARRRLRATRGSRFRPGHAVIDTRSFFRPLAADFISVLRRLPPRAWDLPTSARSWSVRDVLAHLVDGVMRRLSFDRDGMAPPPPRHPIAGERDFVAFINELNREWVSLARRFSPPVLTELYATAALDLAAFFEQVPLDAPARFGVSWAGEAESQAWFDIGREFTEQWHHQQQIRDAVGEPAPANPEWLRAVLAIAMRGLPHAYRDVAAPDGATLLVEVTGASGGTWLLQHRQERWSVSAGAPADTPDARAVMSDDTAWRLLFNGLGAGDTSRRVETSGAAALTAPLLRARSVIV
jgi:uncharacterized protein (TIGR03083 family)